MTFETGPYVQAALLCDRVLFEKDDTLSVVRVIDRWTIVSTGPGASTEFTPTSIAATLLIILKAGEALGSMSMKVRIEKPSGEQLAPEQFSSAPFGAAHQGFNLAMQVNLQVDQAGVWWFDVFCNDALLTRVPLEVVYQYSVSG